VFTSRRPGPSPPPGPSRAASPPPGPSTGQASAEYVGLLALVAVLLTAALAFSGAVPALGRSLVDAVRHGICLVSGNVCTPREARQAGLQACPLFRRSRDEEAGASVAIIALARGDAMAIERRSDGSASVSFMDGGKAGVTGSVGLRLSPLHIEAAVSGTAGAQFTAGRTWEFRTVAAAAAFVRRYASGESLGGEARALGQKLCFLCPGWLRGRGRPKLPPPASQSIEGGVFAEATAALGIQGKAGYPLSLDPSIGVVLGRQTSGPQTTWYLRVDRSLLAHLGPILSPLAGAHSTSSVLEVTFDRGRPVALAVRAASAASKAPGLGATTVSEGDLADRLREALRGPPGPAGRALEADLTLDLRDPVNLAAVRDFFSGGPPLPSETDALGRRLATDGAFDVRVFDYDASNFDASGDIGLGPHLGAGYQRTVEVRRLLGAWSRLPGDRVHGREDCVPEA
jgi:hypothetical protein